MSVFQSLLLASIAGTFILGAVQVNHRVASIEYSTSGIHTAITSRKSTPSVRAMNHVATEASTDGDHRVNESGILQANSLLKNNLAQSSNPPKAKAEFHAPVDGGRKASTGRTGALKLYKLQPDIVSTLVEESNTGKGVRQSEHGSSKRMSKGIKPVAVASSTLNEVVTKKSVGAEKYGVRKHRSKSNAVAVSESKMDEATAIASVKQNEHGRGVSKSRRKKPVAVSKSKVEGTVKDKSVRVSREVFKKRKSKRRKRVVVSKSKIDRTTTNETMERSSYGVRKHRSKHVMKQRAKPTTGYARTLRSVSVDGLASVKLGVLPEWRAFQRNMVKELTQFANGRQLKPFRLLIATSVSATKPSTSNLFKWARYFESVKKEQFERYGFSDTIHFALNHYDTQFAAWEPFMEEFNSSVALIRQGLSCKVMFWYELSPNITDSYDYIWLVDDDLDTTFLDWTLMRLLLLLLRPLVAQTAIAPVAYKKRSSDYPPMKMKPILENDNLALAVNERIAEVMAPILSAKLWPLIHERLESFDLRSAWRFDKFWSKAAIRWGGKTCGFPAPLIVIHASPLVHLNTRSIKKSKFKTEVKDGVVVRIRLNQEGCIRRYIGSNQKIDNFRDSIIRPNGNSLPYDKSSHEVLVNVVAPKLNCTEKTLNPKKSKWKNEGIWTLDRIKEHVQHENKLTSVAVAKEDRTKATSAVV